MNLNHRERWDLRKQMDRYEQECGPVVTYKVDPSVFKQRPVAVIKQSQTQLAHA